VTLVAVEAAGLSLVAVPGLGVDDGDGPVLGHLAGDAKHAVVARFEVLASHRRQQLRGFGHLDVEFATLEDPETGEGVDSQPGHESFAGGGVVPIAARLAARRVVVVAAQHRPQLGIGCPA
jgi:hypothetical protein